MLESRRMGEMTMNSHRESDPDLTEGIDISHLRIDACSPGGGSTNAMKRPSPERAVADEREQKRMLLRQQENGELDLSGYNKIQLSFEPFQKCETSAPVFRRCVSDSYASPAKTSPALAPAFQSPPEKTPRASPAGKMGGSSPSLPPRPPVFRRSVSDPTSSSSSKMMLRSPSTGEMEFVKTQASDPKKLAKMMAGMRDLAKLFHELLPHNEEPRIEERSHDLHEEENKDLKVLQEESDKDLEECVILDKTTNGSEIQFHCPCGKGYQIFLCGDQLFYKLTKE